VRPSTIPLCPSESTHKLRQTLDVDCASALAAPYELIYEGLLVNGQMGMFLTLGWRRIVLKEDGALHREASCGYCRFLVQLFIAAVYASPLRLCLSLCSVSVSGYHFLLGSLQDCQSMCC
jgi:hypothetical protein